MSSEIERAIFTLLLLRDGKIGLRNVHKTGVLPLAIQALREQLAREQRTEGWVSVDERLPEDMGRYLVVSDGCVYIMPLKKNGLGTKYFECGRIFDVVSSNVTHWRPLPNPPKEVIE